MGKRPASNRTKRDYEEALRESRGFVSAAADLLDLHPTSVYRALRRWPDLNQVRSEAEERFLDIAEQKLVERVEAGDMGAIKFLLSTKGKRRGYTLRAEEPPVQREEDKEVLAPHEIKEIMGRILSDEALEQWQRAHQAVEEKRAERRMMMRQAA